MKKNLGLGVLFGILAVSGYAQQKVENNQELEQLKEVVVSDSKFELNPKTSGKVITKITNDVIERSKGLSVSEVLVKYAGIQINESTGNAGNPQGVYIRGSRNRQVLVRVNGVTVNDPSATGGEFDFRFLNLNQIESIEVLKGGSSTLYGSGAAAAVVNIKLKENSAKPIEADFNFSFGTNQNSETDTYSFNDNRISGGIRGKINKFSYLITASNQSTNGLSSAEPLIDNEQFETNPFNKHALYAKLGYKFTEKINYQLYANYDQINSSFDDGALLDGNNSIYSKQRRVGNVLSYTHDNSLEFNYTDGFAWSDREVSSSFPASFKSYSYNFDGYFTKTFDFGLKAATGVNGSFSKLSVKRIPFGETNLEELLSDTDANFDIIDPYLNLVYNSEFGFNLNLGARLNIHSDYGNHLVYSVNPSYNIDINQSSFFQILGSYSTAYITPSLSQLYDNSFGSANPDLEPEQNTTVEGGFKYEINNKVNFSSIYFHRNHSNTIVFNDFFQYDNETEDFETQGVEVDLGVKLLKNNVLSINANYTYTDVKDLPNNVRIAKDVFNMSIGYDLTKSTNLMAYYQYRGERDDVLFFPDFSSEALILGEYHLLDFQLNQKVTPEFNVFARVSNLLNEEYQEVAGYETRGRNIKIGLNFNF